MRVRAEVRVLGGLPLVAEGNVDRGLLPGTREVSGIELETLRGRPALWAVKRFTAKDWDRVAEALLAASYEGYDAGLR